MAITNGYATLAEVKNRLDITDTNDDATIEIIIEAVSRAIDVFKETWFFEQTQTRYYTARWHDRLDINDADLLEVTTLKTDDDGDRTYATTWLTTDFDLMPFNAPLQSPPAPYRTIAITPEGDESFPIGLERGVEIVGKFGYSAGASSAAPLAIREACALASMKIFKRKNSVDGVAGQTSLGQLTTITVTEDKDVLFLLDSIKTERIVH